MIRLTKVFFSTCLLLISAIAMAEATPADLELAAKIAQLRQTMNRTPNQVGAEPTAASLPAGPGTIPLQPTASAAPSATPNPSAQAQATNQGNLYDQAFTGTVNQVLPMTPEQINRLKQLFNETQYAAASPAVPPAKPVTTSVAVNLAPSATPPVIRLGAGFVSSLVFMDATGQSWPVEAYSIGDPTAFNIQWDKKGNTLLVQAISFYKRSNLAVILKGLETPVMLTLLSGQEAIDYRVDLRVPGLGPNAVIAQNGLPDGTDPIMLDVLNGVPPKNSKTIQVRGGDCQAWLLGNRLFLRTTLDVISPAWKSVMSNIDGTHAYELQPAPVILALQRGKDKTLILTLEGLQ
jgi:intracellular multiplication protein IcmK